MEISMWSGRSAKYLRDWREVAERNLLTGSKKQAIVEKCTV